MAPALADIVEAKFRYDAADPRFCAATARRREADMARLRRLILPAECEADDAPSGGPVAPADVAAARSLTKRNKVAHPEDGVVPESLVYGGAAVDEAAAPAFSRVFETGVVPATS